mgnify:CR=1 FL=1
MSTPFSGREPNHPKNRRSRCFTAPLVILLFAYGELEQAGYLCSVAGKGSFAAHPGREEVRREQEGKLEQHLRAAATLAKEAALSREEFFFFCKKKKKARLRSRPVLDLERLFVYDRYRHS